VIEISRTVGPVERQVPEVEDEIGPGLVDVTDDRVPVRVGLRGGGQVGVDTMASRVVGMGRR
jgi:hypothetical protein